MNVNPSFAVDNVKKSSLSVSNGNTLYVGGNGEGNYTKIQDAIDNASDGDTVFVYDDSSPYYECLFLNKSLSLVGEDRYSTVVDANVQGSVVEVYADGCLVSGFTLKNCKEPVWSRTFDVVKIFDSDYVKVSDNILSIGEMEYNGFLSVVELYHSCYCNISGNIIFELDKVQNSVGVEFSTNSCYNTISGNIISNYVWGIRFDWYTGCDGNIISGNHISNSTSGIELTGCNDNKILNNIIEYNRCQGIRLTDALNTMISGNVIQFNGKGYEFDCGIDLLSLSKDCSHNTISGNIISNNNPTGIEVIYAFDNVITGNNFIDNYGPTGNSPKKWWGNAYFCLPFRLKSLFHANSWDGNFWSDYKGFGVKIIPGDIEILGNLLMFGWFQFDWHPALEPYDIGG
jgi:parallel beta-helix repeat protein